MRQSNSNDVAISAIATELEKLKLEPKLNIGWGGQRLDILAITPNGLSIAVEVKQWQAPTSSMLDKAKKEVDLLLETGSLDYALIVIPSLPDDWQTENIRNLNGLLPVLQNLISLKPDFGVRGMRSTELEPGKTYIKRIFVAMPFAAQFEDTYYLGILPSAEKVSACCDRVDENYLSQKILDQIYAGISGSDLVIADLSNSNPNVTYELGFAHALKKHTIHLSSTPPEQLPFDLRQWSTIMYVPGQVYRLRNELEIALPKALGIST